MSNFGFYVHLQISLRKQGTKAAVCKLLGGNDPTINSTSLVLRSITHTHKASLTCLHLQLTALHGVFSLCGPSIDMFA